jgi:hypothetical protein
LTSLGLGLGQYRQEHGGEDADDGDHHQQLNQRETSLDFYDFFHFMELGIALGCDSKVSWRFKSRFHAEK